MRDGYCARCARWILRQYVHGADGKPVRDEKTQRWKRHWVHAQVVYNDGVPDVIDAACVDTCGGEPIKLRMPERRRSRSLRPRDSQKAKVYAWELANIPCHYADTPRVQHSPPCKPMTIAECAALANKIGRAYRWLPIRVKATHGGGRAHGSTLIRLGVACRTPSIVCHEVAHLLTDDWHGPKFVRVYLDLLARYCKLPMRELRASARRARIKVAKKSAVRQTKGRCARARRSLDPAPTD